MVWLPSADTSFDYPCSLLWLFLCFKACFPKPNWDHVFINFLHLTRVPSQTRGCAKTHCQELSCRTRARWLHRPQADRGDDAACGSQGGNHICSLNLSAASSSFPWPSPSSGEGKPRGMVKLPDHHFVLCLGASVCDYRHFRIKRFLPRNEVSCPKIRSFLS